VQDFRRISPCNAEKYFKEWIKFGKSWKITNFKYMKKTGKTFLEDCIINLVEEEGGKRFPIQDF
jgi:hypothetical protein